MSGKSSQSLLSKHLKLLRFRNLTLGHSPYPKYSAGLSQFLPSLKTTFESPRSTAMATSPDGLCRVQTHSCWQGASPEGQAKPLPNMEAQKGQLLCSQDQDF